MLADQKKTSFNGIHMKCIALLILMVGFAVGCTDGEEKNQFQQQQAALYQKEQELDSLKQLLQGKEQELIQREQKLDSALKTDTVMLQDSTRLYNPAIAGLWAVKMTCTKTTCAGSAVGDTKNEQWEIAYEANQVLARAMAGDQLVRVYSGKVTEGGVELKASSDSASAQPAPIMVVTLRVVDSLNMEGEREIIRSDCRVIYALQLAKQK